jgi:predicted unusual protein kinase regulating ubiquinone biosynthesis (AarF/ABC1/UbiB family)
MTAAITNIRPSSAMRFVKRGVQIAGYVVRTYENVKRIQGGDPDGIAAESFVRDTSDIGPIAVKLSQFLSARGDVLDEHTMRVVERFQNEVVVVKEDLPEFTFYEFDDVPIASASIASVYKGRRKCDNKDVVLKRVRPRVKERITEDLPLFIMVLEVAKFLGFQGAENMVEIVRECRPMLLGELDLRKEAITTRVFKKEFAHIDWLTIPEVYEAGETYMISEYMPSRKITDACPSVFLARRLFELYARMILDAGIVHADPHAGNIGVREDGTFVLYDFGATIDVRDVQQNIARCIQSIVADDSDGVIRALEELDIIKSGASAGRLRRIVPKLKKIASSEDFNAELSKIPEFTQNENRIFELTTKYVYLIRSLTIVEGIVRYHDPKFSLKKYIKKFEDLVDVDVPIFDVLGGIASDFASSPASLKNLNELLFAVKEDMDISVVETRRFMRYALSAVVLLELLKLL